MTAQPNIAPVEQTDSRAAGDQIADYEARLDPEALLLCSLMWVEGPATGDMATILKYLSPHDFRRPAHGRLFELMQRQTEEGKLITPAALAGRIDANRDHRGWPDGHHEPLLVAILSLQALPVQAAFYADQVLAESYRRQYAHMTTTLAQAAREAPEQDLFAIMLQKGTEQRAAWERRQGLADALNNPATTNPEE